MCNDYRLEVDIATIAEDFEDLKIKIRFTDGVPNLEPRSDIRITDVGPIVRAVDGEPGLAELVNRRWSWPGPSKKPVYVLRSEGRDFRAGRCLIVADGFYEFTTPADPAKKRKDKWLFTKADEPWFCIAGVWRSSPDVGEAFAMLTTEPGPDVKPYHNRGVAVLDRSQWASWLNPATLAQDFLRPSPAGTLHATQVG